MIRDVERLIDDRRFKQITAMHEEQLATCVSGRLIHARDILSSFLPPSACALPPRSGPVGAKIVRRSTFVVSSYSSGSLAPLVKEPLPPGKGFAEL
jgi:hypothetical protein